MSEEQAYKLRWRGREAGPFPVTEINRQLDEHEIGMGHEIFYEENWITVEEFFISLAQASAPPEPPAEVVLPLPPPKASPPPVTMPEKISPLRIKVSVGNETEIDQRKVDSARSRRPRYRLVFALLGVCFGFAGLHNFYARQWLTGLLQILLSVATVIMGFGILASWLWAMIEAIFVHHDGDGIEMI